MFIDAILPVINSIAGSDDVSLRYDVRMPWSMPNVKQL